jgi:hypothetical protein
MQRQVDADEQTGRLPVLGGDGAAERLDVAAGDPQPDTEMRAVVVVLLAICRAL